jgi:hypothetical protein
LLDWPEPNGNSLASLNRSSAVFYQRGERTMPERETIKRAKRDKRAGKSPATQAGEFVREEMHHVREGKHGARSAKQVIAIGLSKARRAGVKLQPPKEGSRRTRRSAERALSRGRARRRPSAARSRATRTALRREGRAAASRSSLSRQARSTARMRGTGSMKAAARRAARTRPRKK